MRYNNMLKYSLSDDIASWQSQLFSVQMIPIIVQGGPQK